MVLAGFGTGDREDLLAGPRPLGVREMGTNYKKSTMIPIAGDTVK